MDFAKAPTIIFFHIPRTGGSTFWHSLIKSLEDKNVEIWDTYHLSQSRYGSGRHEQEIFDDIVSSLTLNPRIIHVHSSIDFSKSPENTLFVHGIRNNWKWRKSWIAHNIKVMIQDYSNPSKQDKLQNEFHLRKNEILKKILSVLSMDIKVFYDNPTIKNDQIKKIVYNMNEESMLATLVQVHEYLSINPENIIIKRFTNQATKNRDKHDLEGFLFNFVSLLVLLLTYPFYFTTKVLQKGIRTITGQAQSFSELHKTPLAQYELVYFQEKLNNKHGRGLVRQNILSNPSFENCSSEVLSVNQDRTVCAHDWYLNRGGEVYFRQFSRSLGRLYPEELETFVEIENRGPQNSFFEIVQEVELRNLPIKLAGEKSVLSFEKRLFGGLSNNAKAYAIFSYYSVEVNDLRIINTVHEIPKQEKSEQSIWEKHFFVSRIPKNAARVSISILVQSSTGLDAGLAIHLKNMRLSLG